MRRSYVHLLVLSLLCFALMPLWPVAARDEWHVTVTQVDMSHYPEVTVHASVMDEKGNAVSGLSRDDFQVTEDSVLVKLIDFAGIGQARPADIVFVFDTTTSMVEEVDGMKRTSLAFADKLEKSGINYRLGLVDFGDVINRVEKPDGQLTDDAQQFKGWINQIRLAGGGYNIPEYSLGALQQATRMPFRDRVLKIFILITDAPPHHYGDPPDANVTFKDPTLTLAQTLEQLNQTNVTGYLVTPEHSDYSQIAKETNGQFFNIHGSSDFTTIIDKIGGLIATQYRLVYTSPRPTYDGTRRNIEITVGGTKGAATYLETHLLNIQSDSLVGGICLLPLLVMLLAPVGARLISSKSRPVAPALPTNQPEVKQPPPQPQPVSLLCLNCGAPLRAGAKFCNRCGQVVAAMARPIEQQSVACPHCHRSLRPGAKFCSSCGQRV
jgi:VWFA-related protein